MAEPQRAACPPGSFSQVKGLAGTTFRIFNGPDDPVKIRANTIDAGKVKTEKMVEVVPELTNFSQQAITGYRLGWVTAWKDPDTGETRSDVQVSSAMPLPARLATGKSHIALRHEIPLFRTSPEPQFVAFFLAEVEFSDGAIWTADTGKLRVEITK